jgi:hypothetical protein
VKPEEALQVAVIDFLRLAMPASEGIYFHVPNGGKRSKIEAARFSRMGVLAGVPDLCFVLKGGRVGFIELKAGKGKASEAQRMFRDAVLDLGGEWAAARTRRGFASQLRRHSATLCWRLPHPQPKQPRPQNDPDRAQG